MIYLDHNATSRLLPEVRAEMDKAMDQHWANPSSAHALGLSARAALEKARTSIAQLVAADPSQVLFTGSATEANNTALAAVLANCPGRVVTAATEHSAVLAYCRAQCAPSDLVVLPVNPDGRIDLAQLDAALVPGTTLFSLMWANNETGVIHPIEPASALCRARNILFHCDAVQAAGRIPLNLRETPVDYLSLSSHKMHGPKGVGALVVGNGAPYSPLLHGGHQEMGRRAGTENVPGIVGFGKAADLARIEMPARTGTVTALRDRLETGITKRIEVAYVNGGLAPRLPNTTNLGFRGVDSDTLVTLLDQRGICVSSGSACLADSVTPSHVVQAMTNSYERANEAVRFSLSHLNTVEEIDTVIEEVVQAVDQLV